VIESTQTPDGPTQLGTKFKTVRTFLGQHLEATGEVTQFVPNQKFAARALQGRFSSVSVKASKRFRPERRLPCRSRWKAAVSSGWPRLPWPAT
jgi:hypothetical protein